MFNVVNHVTYIRGLSHDGRIEDERKGMLGGEFKELYRGLCISLIQSEI